MNEPLPRPERQYDPKLAIRSFVVSLVRRERALLLGRIAVQALALTLLMALLATLAAAFSWDRSIGAAVLVLVGGAGSFVAIGAPLIVGWRRTADRLRQARLVEGLRPRMEGRFLTSVERIGGPLGQESPVIVDLIARRAWERLGALRPGSVHRAWPLLLGMAGLVAVAIVTLASNLLVVGGPFGTWQYWTASEGEVALEDAPDKGTGEFARVGDLVLEYIYPAYTGLEPMVVANTSGEAHGPPGTQVKVRARSADPIDGAAVVAYDTPGEGTEVDEGRIIRGQFIIQAEEGVWRLDLLSGDATRSSRDFPIVAEPDLAPDIIVDAPRRLEVAVDSPLGVPWQARDDYGLTRVVLLIDGKEVSTIRTLDASIPEAEGVLKMTPAQLGMSPGMRVKLQVGAWDNNGWSGSQLGMNEPPIELIIKRGDEIAQLGPEQRIELRDVLVDVLAAQLMQPWPPGGGAGAIARSGQTFNEAYAPLDEFLEATPAVYRDNRVRYLVRRAREAGQDFVAYTQVNFDPRLQDGPVSSDLVRQAGELRATAIEENEFVIVWLDRFIQMRALGQVLEEASVLANLGERLVRELDREASDAEVAGALERVERSLKKMGEAVEFMDRDSVRSMIEGRSREIDLLRKSVSESQKGEDRQATSDLARRMSEQLQELQEDLEYRMKRMDDEEENLGEELKSVVEELKRVEREQRQLQNQVRQARESSDAQGTAEAERMWAEVERLAAEAESKGLDLEQRLNKAGTMFMTREQVAEANRSTGRLGESASARDLHKAQNDVRDALQGWMRVARTVPEGSRRAISQRIEQAERILDQLDRDASTVDPQAAAQARGMQNQQRELEQALQSAQQMAQELAAKMPIEPRGMEEGLQEAAEAMDRASGDLESGRPMPAEGAQGQAAEGVREAREALEQAAAQMAASGKGARSGKPEDGEGGEGENEGEMDLDMEDGGAWNSGELTLEQEFNLEAFQRDVLKGAQGDVPEAYRAMKKRYYEELMTQ